MVLTAGLPRAEERLIAASAASTAMAVKEIAERFEKEGGIKVIVSSGSTGKLARQIESGAPFDLFFSADPGYVERLENRGLIKEGTFRVYARGRIVLAVKAGGGTDVRELKDLLRSSIKRVAIANPVHAPYGRAAEEALRGAGLWERLRPKLVYGENVRQALQFVETGNAQAAVVALSVAKETEGIDFKEIDSALYRPMDQAAAVLKRTARADAAERFLSYVTGPAGRAVLKRHGFVLP